MDTANVIMRFELDRKTDLKAFGKVITELAKKEGAVCYVLGGVGKDSEPVQNPNKELDIMMNLVEKRTLAIPGYAPKEYTQTGIAKAVGLDVSVVSRYLKSIFKRGLIEQCTLNIVGDARRRRVYFVTKKGTDLLDKLFQSE